VYGSSEFTNPGTRNSNLARHNKYRGPVRFQIYSAGGKTANLRGTEDKGGGETYTSRFAEEEVSSLPAQDFDWLTAKFLASPCP